MIFLPIDETMCRLTFERVKFRQISLGDAKVEPKYWKRLGSPPPGRMRIPRQHDRMTCHIFQAPKIPTTKPTHECHERLHPGVHGVDPKKRHRTLPKISSCRKIDE